MNEPYIQVRKILHISEEPDPSPAKLTCVHRPGKKTIAKSIHGDTSLPESQTHALTHPKGF